MATNESYVMTSHNLLNYSGMLFAKGNSATPFSTLIGGKSRTTQSFKFPTSLIYEIGGGEQPAITESASLTAPDPSFKTRSQNINVCQIFQKALSISYAKESSMDQLSGLNIAGQQANPQNELDFQVGIAMKELAKDIEYTFINGVYQDGTYDDVAYKTRGILNAISSIVVDAQGSKLTYWVVAEVLRALASEAPVDNLVLMLKPVQVMQLNADCSLNKMSIVPASREVNGIKIDTLVTPFGSIGLLVNSFLPDGTAVIVNPTICAPVYMPVPSKGNFFLEQLAKTGAADKYQIYGQLGLDYGAEHYHAKITGLDTGFVAPDYGGVVKISGPVATVETDAAPVSATLSATEVEEGSTVGVSAISYNIVPATDPSVAYLWQKKAADATSWTNMTSVNTGYNTATVTAASGDATKLYRCKITASGSATGTIYTDNVTVKTAG